MNPDLENIVGRIVFKVRKHIGRDTGLTELVAFAKRPTVITCGALAKALRNLGRDGLANEVRDSYSLALQRAGMADPPVAVRVGPGIPTKPRRFPSDPL
jgi:hypothetical protein